MIVSLIEDYFVDIDSNNNFTLKKICKGKSKKDKTMETEYEKTFGYYGDMAGALKRCAMEIVKENNEEKAIGIGEYVKQLNDVALKLDRMFL